MNNLDICSPSYGQKKGQESNWQFDSRPLKAGNGYDPDVCRRSADGVKKLSRRATTLVETSPQSDVGAGRYELPKSRESNPGQFRDSSWESREKVPFRCSLRGELQRILYGEGGGFSEFSRGESSESK
jgi:hypothetical protein